MFVREILLEVEMRSDLRMSQKLQSMVGTQLLSHISCKAAQGTTEREGSGGLLLYNCILLYVCNIYTLWTTYTAKMCLSSRRDTLLNYEF